MKPKTFKRWCEDNGRRWMGCSAFEEFKRNADDYEAYLKEWRMKEEDSEEDDNDN